MKLQIIFLLNFVLLLLFASCSNSAMQENSNLSPAENKYDSNNIQDEGKSDSAKKLNFPENWEVVRDRTAMVSAIGKTPDDEVRTVLKLQCPTNEVKVVSIDFIVYDTDKIPSFDFDDFNGPDAAARKSKLVEMQVNSANEKMSWRFAVNGGIGDQTEFTPINAFWFSPSTLNKPDKTTQAARLIASGSAEVIIIVHDYKDEQKTIKATFPAIDVSSNVAKVLNGCRQ